MRFRKRLLIPPSLLLALGILTATSAFGAGDAAKAAGTAEQKGLDGVPDYMVSAAGIDDPSYLACISSKAKKQTAGENMVGEVESALDCQAGKNQ